MGMLEWIERTLGVIKDVLRHLVLIAKGAIDVAVPYIVNNGFRVGSGGGV